MYSLVAPDLTEGTMVRARSATQASQERDSPTEPARAPLPDMRLPSLAWRSAQEQPKGWAQKREKQGVLTVGGFQRGAGRGTLRGRVRQCSRTDPRPTARAPSDPRGSLQQTTAARQLEPGSVSCREQSLRDQSRPGQRKESEFVPRVPRRRTRAARSTSGRAQLLPHPAGWAVDDGLAHTTSSPWRSCRAWEVSACSRALASRVRTRLNVLSTKHAPSSSTSSCPGDRPRLLTDRHELMHNRTHPPRLVYTTEEWRDKKERERGGRRIEEGALGWVSEVELALSSPAQPRPRPPRRQEPRTLGRELMGISPPANADRSGRTAK